jgi:hypothetical protein
MLKKPYQKIHEIELNNYYTLETSDTLFLVTESILPYKKRFKKGEFTIAIKMLPLNSNIMYAFAKVLELKKIGESEEKEGLVKEEYFEILDVKNVRKQFKEIVDNSGIENHKFDYQKPVYNDTIKQLLTEGYDLLATETIGTYMRKYWLMRSDKNGVVRIVEATLGGKPMTSKVVDMKFHTVNRNIILGLLNKIEKGAK